MKFTSVLHYRHAKYYYYASRIGKGWGIKKYKETFHKQWKYEIGINRNLPIEDYVTADRKFEVPAGYVIKDPIDFMNEIKRKPEFTPYPKDRPWPFNTLQKPGTRLNPDYREKRELTFNRTNRLLEGFKGVLNLTNSILESEDALPDKIVNNVDQLSLDDEILHMLDRRLEWCDKLDHSNSRCNTKLIFPRINKWATPEFGATLDRKELNLLTTYADCSELLVSRQCGSYYFPRIISPKYLIGFKLDDHRLILDLRCDFVTLQQNPIEEILTQSQSDSDQQTTQGLRLNNSLNNVKKSNLFSEDVKSTETKELIDIKPIDWTINFELSHFYPDDEILNKPSRINEQSIDIDYLGNNFNIHKPTPDRIVKGKLLMSLYGYAVGRARFLYGNDLDFKHEINYKVLEQPITIKGVFANYSKRNLGFARLQLNTLSFDSSIKNQVWFDGPYDVIDDRETILKKLASMNLHSYELLK